MTSGSSSLCRTPSAPKFAGSDVLGKGRLLLKVPTLCGTDSYYKLKTVGTNEYFVGTFYKYFPDVISGAPEFSYLKKKQSNPSPIKRLFSWSHFRQM